MVADHTPSVARAARLYAAAGWPVLPLHDVAAGVCSCPAAGDCRVGGKHPRSRRGFKQATTDLTVIHGWWRRWPNANIGIATGGVGGLVVVDVDGPVGRHSWRGLTAQHGAGPETATAVTPHGAHRWYRTPEGLSVPRRIGAIGGHVDVLGDGGYAVAPPSVIGREHPDRHDGQCAGRYEWTSPAARLAPLPGWVAEAANRRQQAAAGVEQATPAHVRTAMSADSRGYGQTALAGEVARVANAKAADSNRNNTLNAAAYRLGRLVGGGELDLGVAERGLREAAQACGLMADDGERQVLATIRSGLDAGAMNPRQRPRRQRSADTRTLRLM